MESVQRIKYDHDARTIQPVSVGRVKTRGPARSVENGTDSPARRLFTVDEYHRMGEAGILDEDERVELLDGEILLMSPIGPKHVCGVSRVHNYFAIAFHSHKKAFVTSQNPFVANRRSEPQPDVLLLKWRDDEYVNALAQPEDVLLIVEVSDTSLNHDRSKKLKLYGSIGIREYWILNILDETLECYRVPNKNGYGVKTVYASNRTISPLAFPKKKIAVKDLLPPTPTK